MDLVAQQQAITMIGQWLGEQPPPFEWQSLVLQCALRDEGVWVKISAMLPNGDEFEHPSQEFAQSFVKVLELLYQACWDEQRAESWERVMVTVASNGQVSADFTYPQPS